MFDDVHTKEALADEHKVSTVSEESEGRAEHKVSTISEESEGRKQIL
jgi:hypothetical protein